MHRALTVAAFLVPLAFGVARAGSEQTYAYVTAAEPDWSPLGGGGDFCNLTVQLPNVPILNEPAKRAGSAALDGATLATGRATDPDRQCFDLVHTWQSVRFDPSDRAHVRVEIPRSLRWMFEDALTWVLGITFGVLLSLIVVERYAKKRYASRHRKEAR
jgi:hypothetical protein